MFYALTDLVSRITGEGMVMKYTGGRPTREDIARRAYQHYEARGREDGYDMQDWLRAERELAGAP